MQKQKKEKTIKMVNKDGDFSRSDKIILLFGFSMFIGLVISGMQDDKPVTREELRHAIGSMTYEIITVGLPPQDAQPDYALLYIMFTSTIITAVLYITFISPALNNVTNDRETQKKTRQRTISSTTNEK